MKSSKSKILHIAPFNIANVPLTFVNAERELGYESRLVTLAKHPRGYPEDICLDLPFLSVPKIKSLVSHPSKLTVSNIATVPATIPLQWHPNGFAERLLFNFRESLWKNKIRHAFKRYKLDEFDVIQLDGGLEFFRDGRTIQAFKQQGKKIICCYTGSDLRVRGVIPIIDQLADLNVSVEFDHLKFHPNIHHVFFPFDWKKFQLQKPSEDKIIKIGHAPTNRQAKGSDKIIACVSELAATYPIELVLIENLPYSEALGLKSECDIFIDQIGDLGYGINSLESLAMGIATCSCLAAGFAELYPDHPFIEIDEENMKVHLIKLIENRDLRLQKGAEGRPWVSNYHDSLKVIKRIHQLAGIDEKAFAFRCH
jgi:hypothetical protein